MVKKYSTNINDLLHDGFSKKFADYYLSHVESENSNSSFDQNYVKWAHEHGFLVESAYAYNLNEGNLGEYLSDYDYYKVWPLNNWSRIWVNDKLTLKLMLSDKELEGFMPEYYYYSFGGTLKPLGDVKNSSGDVFKDFIKLLIEKKEFACKPNNGTASVGFVHMQFKDDNFYINGELVDEVGIRNFVVENSNYLFTEYIRPSEQFLKYSPAIHTLRVVVINEDGFSPVIVGGYLRLPNNNSGEANYIVLDGSDREKFNVFCGVDFNTGEFGDARLTFFNRICKTEIHPDTNEKIYGEIEDYSEFLKKIIFISKKFSNLEYIGFDIGVTNKGFKCMEINTHPGIKYMQIFAPFNKDPYLSNYFKKKIQEIDELDEEKKQKRNGILR